jgi:hypothetical protein
VQHETKAIKKNSMFKMAFGMRLINSQGHFCVIYYNQKLTSYRHRVYKQAIEPNENDSGNVTNWTCLIYNNYIKYVHLDTAFEIVCQIS